MSLVKSISAATVTSKVGLPYWLLPIPLALFFAIIYVVYDWRRHRRPLKMQDPNVRYTIWHHLRVVTIPIFKYRISFVISRPSTNSENPPPRVDKP